MTPENTLQATAGLLTKGFSTTEPSIYLYIVAIGLLLKVSVSYKELLSPSRGNRELRPELLIFISSFLAYSVAQIFVFAPHDWTATLGLSRALVVKIYYMFDGICLLIGVYLMLSMLGYQKHKNVWLKVLVLSYVFIGSIFLYGTDAFLSSRLPSEYSGPAGLGGGYGGPMVLLARAVVLACILFVCHGIFRCYEASKENKLQIKSLYSLLACFLYTSNCLIGLFKVYPMNIALRGILFYVVVMVLMRKNNFFDIRLSTPLTMENKVVSDFKDSFRKYASEEINYKEMLNATEKISLQYKIDKATGFNTDLKSALPLAAKNMGMGLGSVYNLIKKHDLDTPNQSHKKVSNKDSNSETETDC